MLRHKKLSASGMKLSQASNGVLQEPRDLRGAEHTCTLSGVMSWSFSPAAAAGAVGSQQERDG